MRYLLSIIFFFLISASSFAQLKTDTSKRVNFAAIPMINYNQTFGFSAGAMGQMYYKLNKKDTISPSSSTGVFGIYTTNKTYFAAAFQKLYINEDKWRLTMAAGFGNLNFQYWQEFGNFGGGFIDFGTSATFSMIKAERKVYKQLYVGLSYTYSNATTVFDLPDFIPDEWRYDERSLNNVGYLLNYDDREHQLNPYGGFNVEFKNAFYRTIINSDNNFEVYNFTYNHYYKLKNNRNIIATRVRVNIAAGDVPFQGQNVVGQDDIRGYSSGKYRDNQVYAIQAEYRWRFYKKLGLVGFAGVATAVENMAEIPQTELLPGIGLGFRYLLIESERINIGMDFAVGKGDWGIYFRIGESFGR